MLPAGVSLFFLIMENIEEIWIDCVGYDGYYAVSNLGRVKSLERTIYDKNGKEKRIKERILCLHYNKGMNGETQVVFSVDAIHKTFNVIELVGMAFIGFKEEGQIYQHINKNRSDPRACNIEITTRNEARVLEVKMGVNPAPVGAKHAENRQAYEQANYISDSKNNVISIKCDKCEKIKPAKSFPVNTHTSKYNHTYSYYKHTCRDCIAEAKGIKEIGKLKFTNDLLLSGKRRCSDCKDIKELSEFPLNKNAHGGYAGVCKECARIRNLKYVDSRKSNVLELKDVYVKGFLKKEGFSNEDMTPELIEMKRQQLKLNREIKWQNSRT